MTKKPKIDIYIEKFFELNRGLHRRLRAYSVYQLYKFHYQSRSRELVKNMQCKPLTASQKREIRDYYGSFGFKNINTEWHRFFTHVSGEFHKEYIPVEFFINVIEPHLNMKKMGEVLIDKNLLDKLFIESHQPETVVKNINGYFIGDDNKSILEMDQIVEKCKKYSKLIIKPSLESGGGKNIIVFEIKNDLTTYKNMAVKDIINLYGKNFIIQNYLVQHEDMSKLNPSSVNTLRIHSLLINDKVEIIASYARIGGKDSHVDNGAVGGIFCPVNEEGILNEKGYNGYGQSFLKTDINVKLGGYKIPNFVNILEEVKKLHQQVPYFRIIAWDIAIDVNARPVLLEFNLTFQGIVCQLAVGPLFGDFTDDILRNCKLQMFS